MANATQTKRINTIDVLRVIRINSNVTKPQIERLTGLTASTVHGIVSELEEKNVIVCSGISSSNGGRKASLYQFNAKYKYVIAVSIRLSVIQVGLLDFDLNVKEILSSKIDLSSLGIEQTITIILNLLKKLKTLEKIDRNLIAGIGVSVPGPVDFMTGTVLELSGAPKWRNYPLKDKLESATGIPTIVDKDLYSAMQFLTYTGKSAENQNVIYLSVCEGIGAGVMINGKIYRGNHSIAGEIGHVTMVQDGKKCRCGSTGCLELYCSDIGIVDLYNSALPLKPKTDIMQIIKTAEKGDITASSIFSDATKHLVQTISNLILMYDPDEIFVNCRWLNLQKTLFFDMLDKLNGSSVFISNQATKIHLIDPQDFYVRSAAAMVAMNEISSIESPLFESSNKMF